MKAINKNLLKDFIELALSRLEGDWLLVGGTVLPLLGANHRFTQDIDFVGLGTHERSQQLEVMKIAEDLNLPIETINPAASLFVERLMSGKKDLILIKKSEKCKVFRPDTIFYFKLKLGRLSESDLSDCLEWLKMFESEINKKTILELKSLVSHELRNTKKNPLKKDRLETLKKQLK